MKISFETLGCKLNQYDTQLLKEMAEASSYKITDFNDEIADIYVINTCSVTMNAAQQSRNIIRRARRKSKNAKIIVTGCYPKEIQNNLKEADIYVSNSSKSSFFENFFSSTKKKISKFDNHTRAFVKVQTGCNRFCSYCIVPYLRGREYSRPSKEIIREIETLVKNKFMEITLTGVHIGRYKDQGKALAKLLKQIESIEGLERIRLGSLNPEEITDELIDIVSESQKICHHFHISLQSGDKKVLRAMGRKYSPSDIAHKLNKITKYINDCGIGADIITGFPSERTEEFKHTYMFIKEFPFTYLHVFRYSPMRRTLAAIMPDIVNESEKKRRSALLRELGLEKSINFRKNYIGKHLSVLVETKRDKLTKMMVGFSGNYIRVLIPKTENCENRFKNVVIQTISGYDTYGRIPSTSL
ncbi:tRNA (N(6)-L-threonylcarbamoyladenosine(37)-C(2))-methylthiotransferase MtaB [candidate division WOR-3 bacterium]|nr:tRNA (N(6)-L-threonylcarbamoyladenosine(37)-C(2))-methylthiotransferase MtaB [candidate division WOR-3 bacterium]